MVFVPRRPTGATAIKALALVTVFFRAKTISETTRIRNLDAVRFFNFFNFSSFPKKRRRRSLTPIPMILYSVLSSSSPL